MGVKFQTHFNVKVGVKFPTRFNVKVGVRFPTRFNVYVSKGRTKWMGSSRIRLNEEDARLCLCGGGGISLRSGHTAVVVVFVLVVVIVWEKMHDVTAAFMP